MVEAGTKNLNVKFRQNATSQNKFKFMKSKSRNLEWKTIFHPN